MLLQINMIYGGMLQFGRLYDTLCDTLCGKVNGVVQACSIMSSIG